MKTHALEDYATLTQHMHDMRASKEEVERQLAKMRKMLDEAKKDWQKKMKERRKEVNELKRRQEHDELRELKRCAPLSLLSSIAVRVNSTACLQPVAYRWTVRYTDVTLAAQSYMWFPD